LLEKIALQRFEQDEQWTDFTLHEDVEDATDQLADRLLVRLGGKDLEWLAQRPTGRPCQAASKLLVAILSGREITKSVASVRFAARRRSLSVASAPLPSFFDSLVGCVTQ
jgi:hypothetical protein